MANIIYRKGNLLDVQSGVIAHGVNCQGVMGSGVALAIKQKYPAAYSNYHKKCKDHFQWPDKPTSAMLGDVQVVKINDNLRVANCFTQDSYGINKRQVNYEAVSKCFRELDIRFVEVNIPKIGAGLGGGNWKVIEAIIDAEFEGDVTVWEL